MNVSEPIDLSSINDIGLLLHNAARMVCHAGHRPCGCQGINELKDPSRSHGFRGLNVEGYEKSPNPRATGPQGIESLPLLAGGSRNFGVSKSKGLRGK